MFLFIFESIGTSELILVGIVALVLLGPRKLPELARKAGKIMAEFRGTASEFKETWQREVNFEEEAKALNINDLDAEPVARRDSDLEGNELPDSLNAPRIKSIDPASFEFPEDNEPSEDPEPFPETVKANDKKNWL